LKVQARDKATKSRVRVQALSPQQFEDLKKAQLVSQRKQDPLIAEEKKEIDEQNNEESSHKQRPPLLVDPDLMISKPFPNPMDMNVQMKELTPQPEEKESIKPNVETKNTTQSNSASTSHLANGMTKQSEVVKEKNNGSLQNKMKKSVIKKPTLLKRLIRWITTYFGRQ
jgi:hypothetical protein